MDKLTSYCLAGFLTLGSGVAYAQDSDPDSDSDSDAEESSPVVRGYTDTGHGYVGGSYGSFKARGDAFDDESELVEVTLGGMFNRHIGVEANAAFFGEYGDDALSSDTKGYGLSLVGRVPLSNSWGLYAKGGQFFWDSDIETADGSIETDGSDPFYSAGMDFRLAENLNMIIEYTRYEINAELEELSSLDCAADLDTVKIGLRVRF